MILKRRPKRGPPETLAKIARGEGARYLVDGIERASEELRAAKMRAVDL